MENKEKIEILVYRYDSNALGFQPKAIRSQILDITHIPEIITTPSFAERITVATWDVLFQEYRQNYPSGTVQEFLQLGTFAGHKKYVDAMNKVAKTLPEVITGVQLKEFIETLKKASITNANS